VKFVKDPPSPDSIKKKCLLLLKTRTGSEVPEINEGNIDKEVIIMEINRKILENLYLICNEVYMPVLGNPLNMIGWSDLVTKDLMDKFHVFLAHTYVTLGQVEGRTMLPLPPNDVTSVEKTSSKDKANLLENAIIHWTKQIKNVLKRDPEMVLKTGTHPGPLSELEFWENKSEDLQSICAQLGSERIKRVLKFLEQNKSTYTGPFSKLQKEVQIARNEAVQNYRYLMTLSTLFNDLISTGTDLPEVIELFAPIMQTILLIWQYSQHYNTPARLVVLIREICNAIIIRCRDAI
jgi:dynein heavy chain